MWWPVKERPEYWDGSELYENNKGVVSRYDSATLRQRLNYFNDPKCLFAIDVDGTIKSSPAMNSVVGSIVDPRKWGRWITKPGLSFDFCFMLIVAGMMNWDRERIEEFSLTYTQEHMKKEDVWFRDPEVAKIESPPLFPGVNNFLRYFDKAKKVIVSRNYPELVDLSVACLGLKENGFAAGYSLAECGLGKDEVVMDLIRDTDIDRVFVWGDLPIDMNVGVAAKAKGYESDVLVTCRDFGRRFDKRGSIFIPRDVNGLEAFVQ